MWLPACRCRRPARSSPVLRCLLAAAFALLVAGTSTAQERVIDTAVEIRVLDDGRLDITERIEVRAEGRRIRHGIVRTLPTHYRDHHGNRVTAELEVQEVLRDGQPEPWTRRRMGDAVQIRIGDAGYLATPSQPVYTVRYRSRRQVMFDPAGDALSINAIGLDHAVPVERGSVTVSLPRPVPVASLRAGGSTGADGAAGRDYRVDLSASGTVRWTLTRPLQPGEGLTVALTFPHGLVTPPGRQQRIVWWLGDHTGPLLALAGLALLVGYCLLRWRQVRRHPDAGRVPVRADPPAGVSPAGLRYLRRMRYDARCFTADLLASAVQDHVHILRERTPAGTGWRLVRAREGAHTLPTMEQRALLAGLLPQARSSVVLDPAHADIVGRARQAHDSALRRRFRPAMFRASGGSVLIALGLAAAFAAAALAATRSGAMTLTLLALTPMLPVLLVFTLLVKVPTGPGRQLLAHIEGLRRYLGGASLPGGADAAPAMDAAHYQSLLPHAVALDVEEAWTARFSAALGAAAAGGAVREWRWYRGIEVTDVRRFSRSVGVRLATRLAAVDRRQRRHRVPAAPP